MLGYAVISQEPFLERTVSNQQEESQLPATNVIPNRQVIFLIVVFQTFCCMAITQSTALKDLGVLPAALGLFTTELPTNLYLVSSKVIQMVHSKHQEEGSWCSLWCPWVLFLSNTEEEEKVVFLTPCSVLKQEHKRTAVEAPSHPMSSLQLVMESIFQQQSREARVCNSQMLNQEIQEDFATDLKVESTTARYFVIKRCLCEPRRLILRC